MHASLQSSECTHANGVAGNQRRAPPWMKADRNPLQSLLTRPSKLTFRTRTGPWDSSGEWWANIPRAPDGARIFLWGSKTRAAPAWRACPSLISGHAVGVAAAILGEVASLRVPKAFVIESTRLVVPTGGTYNAHY